MDAYEDLKSSVGTKLLGSQPLRLGLSRLNALTDRYRHSETNSTQVQLINIDHYLADNFPMRQFNRVFENAKGLPDLKSENAPDYAEFISRQETQNRITMKYISITNQLTTLVGPSNLVSELRVLLSQRLGELGESQGSE